MIKSIPKATAFRFLKSAFILGLGIYALVVTILLLKLNPNPIVIGMDSLGTRIISGDLDPALRSERETFVKQFLTELYNYDSSNFESQISKVGDMMNGSLWDEKRVEFGAISDRMKTEPISETASLTDLREIDGNHFEADLVIEIQNRLKKSSVKLRTKVEIAPIRRTIQNPYPWEVKAYEEQSDE